MTTIFDIFVILFLVVVMAIKHRRDQKRLIITNINRAMMSIESQRISDEISAKIKASQDMKYGVPE